MKIKLTNDFHGTEITLIPRERKIKGYTRHTLSGRQVSKARATLCGVRGCTCGDLAGTRGRQRQDDGTVVDLEPMANGGAYVEIIEAD